MESARFYHNPYNDWHTWCFDLINLYVSLESTELTGSALSLKDLISKPSNQLIEALQVIKSELTYFRNEVHKKKLSGGK